LANINSIITYNANLSPAQAQIKALTGQVAGLTTAFNALDKSALKAQRSVAATFAANVGQIGGFTAQTVKATSAVESFGKQLAANKLTMREYFREAITGYTRQSSLMRQLAEQQVRYQQSVAVPIGGGQAMMLTPQSINAASSAAQLASARFSIFNELVNGGATSMLNWGKNTQWAGRQLMVGFTLPLALFAGAMSKQFRELDKELTRFQKVYGSDLGNSVSESTQRMRDQVQQLAYDISSAYGIAAKETAALAADIAATGAEGENLMASVQQTTRLAVLGEVDRQEAMKATLSLQSAFRMSTDELAESINFLNAVENQTSATLEDLSTAIPKVGPIVRSLGGDVKDLATLLVAMREGGIPAAEAANALKSGLASLINPTKQASAVAKQFGVDLVGIVEGNQGQLMPTIYAMQNALQGLDSFSRSRIIEQIFGKYQFARMTALFDNIGRVGSQTQSVIELASKSSAELAAVANGEIKTLTESTAVKFQRTLEQLKNSLMPVGQALTETLIPILEKVGEGIKMFSTFFSSLPDSVKGLAKWGVALTALAGPVIMLVGLFGNLIANGLKFGMMIVRLGARMAGIKTEKFQLLDENLMAAKLGVDNLTSAFTTQEVAMRRLVGALAAYEQSLGRLAVREPGLFVPGAVPGARGAAPIRRQKGSTAPEKVPGGYGGGDRIPALLEPGESVITKEATAKFWPVIEAMNRGNLPGFNRGAIFLGMPRGYKDIQGAKQVRQTLSSTNVEATTGRFAKLPITDVGERVTSIGGRSSSIPGVNGVYEQGGKKYVVKTHDTADSALAEVRGTQLTRDVFGLDTPVQELIKIKHPVTGDVIFAVRSPYDAKFASSTGVIDEKNFFGQALAGIVRRDKDLQPDNLYGNIVTDVGQAFVANKASQPRIIGGELPSVAEQTATNFLMSKGGAKKWFAETTAPLARTMSEDDYVRGFQTTIAEASRKARGAIDNLPYMTKEERVMYSRIIDDLDEAAKIDWRAVYQSHRGITPEVKKPPTAAALAKKEALEAEKARQRGDMARWEYGLPLTFNKGGMVPGKYSKGREPKYGHAKMHTMGPKDFAAYMGFKENAAVVSNYGAFTSTVGSQALNNTFEQVRKGINGRPIAGFKDWMTPGIPWTQTAAKQMLKVLRRYKIERTATGRPYSPQLDASIRELVSLTKRTNKKYPFERMLAGYAQTTAAAERAAGLIPNDDISLSKREKELYEKLKARIGRRTSPESIYEEFKKLPKEYLATIKSGRLPFSSTGAAFDGKSAYKNLISTGETSTAARLAANAPSYTRARKFGSVPEYLLTSLMARRFPRSVVFKKDGGQIPGYGGGDIIPAYLEPGEFVIRKEVTRENKAFLENINSGKYKKFQLGGMSGNEPALLEPGEFVVNSDASAQYAPILRAMNRGTIGKYEDGRDDVTMRPGYDPNDPKYSSPDKTPTGGEHKGHIFGTPVAPGIPAFGKNLRIGGKAVFWDPSFWKMITAAENQLANILAMSAGNRARLMESLAIVGPQLNASQEQIDRIMLAVTNGFMQHEDDVTLYQAALKNLGQRISTGAASVTGSMAGLIKQVESIKITGYSSAEAQAVERRLIAEYQRILSTPGQLAETARIAIAKQLQIVQQQMTATGIATTQMTASLASNIQASAARPFPTGTLVPTTRSADSAELVSTEKNLTRAMQFREKIHRRLLASEEKIERLNAAEARIKADTSMSEQKRKVAIDNITRQLEQEKINRDNAETKLKTADEFLIKAKERAAASYTVGGGGVSGGRSGGTGTPVGTSGGGRSGGGNVTFLGMPPIPPRSGATGPDAAMKDPMARMMRGQGLMNVAFMGSMAVGSLGALGVASEEAASKLGMLSMALMALPMLQMMNPKGMATNFLGLKSLGGKMQDAGAARQAAGAAAAPAWGTRWVGNTAANVASGGPKLIPSGMTAGSGLLTAGRSLSLLGGPPGIALALGITAVVTAYMLYKKAADEARERAIASFEDPAKSAEYFGETIDDLAAELENRSGRFKIGDMVDIDPELRKIVGEEYAPLIDRLKYSQAEDGARQLSLAYNNMLINGLSAENAQATLKAIAAEAGVQGGAAYTEAFSNSMLNAENVEEAITKQMDLLNPERNKALVQKLQSQVPALDAAIAPARMDNVFSQFKLLGEGIKDIALPGSGGPLNIFRMFSSGDPAKEGMEIAGEFFGGFNKVWTAATADIFDSTVEARARDAAVNAADQAKTSIQELMSLSADSFNAATTDFMKAYEDAPEKVLESIQTAATWVEATDDNLEIMKTGLIELNPILEGLINTLETPAEIGIFKQLLTVGLDPMMFFDENGFNEAAAATSVATMGFYDELDKKNKETFDGLKENTIEFIDEEIKATNKGIRKINDYWDSWAKVTRKEQRQAQEDYDKAQRRSEKFIDAKQDEIEAIEDTMDTRREEFDEKMQDLQDEKDLIEESTDKYIDSLTKRKEADSFYAQQRRTSFSALEKLASGDVFGFLQDREQMSQDAQGFSYDQMISGIEDRRDLEVDAIDETMEKERRRQEEWEKAQRDKIDGINDLIDAERDLMEERTKAHEKDLRQFEKRQKTIETNRKQDLKGERIKLADLTKAREKAESLELADYEEMSTLLGEKYKDRYDKQIYQLQREQFFIRYNTELYKEKQEMATNPEYTQRSNSQILTDAFTAAFGTAPGPAQGGALGQSVEEILKQMGVDPNNPQVTLNNPDAPTPGRANGGLMGGGKVSGPGGPKSDVIPAMLSNGEYVIQASSVKKYGTDLMHTINAGKFADGGMVQGFARGGLPAGTSGNGRVSGYIAGKYGSKKMAGFLAAKGAAGWLAAVAKDYMEKNKEERKQNKFANGGIIKASNGTYVSADRAAVTGERVNLRGNSPSVKYTYTPGSNNPVNVYSSPRNITGYPPNLTAYFDTNRRYQDKNTPDNNYQAKGKYAEMEYRPYAQDALDARTLPNSYSGGKKWQENMSRLTNLGLNSKEFFDQWRNLRRWEKEQFVRSLGNVSVTPNISIDSKGSPANAHDTDMTYSKGSPASAHATDISYNNNWWTNYESKAKAYVRSLPGGADKWMIEHFNDTDGHHSYRVIPRAADNRPWWQKMFIPAYDDGLGHLKGLYDDDGTRWPDKGDKGTAVDYGWANGGIVGFKNGSSNPTWYSADRAEQAATGTRRQTSTPSSGNNTTYYGSTTNATSPYTYTPGWSPTPYKLPAQRYGPYGVGRIPGTRRPYNIPEFGRTADLSAILASNYSHKLGAYATTSQHLEYLRKKASERQLLDGGGGKKWNIISSILSSSSPLAMGAKERLANSARDIPTLDYWRTLSREQKAWFLEYAATGGTNNWSNSRVFKLMPWLPKETRRVFERGLPGKLRIPMDRGAPTALNAYPNTVTIGQDGVAPTAPTIPGTNIPVPRPPGAPATSGYPMGWDVTTRVPMDRPAKPSGSNYIWDPQRYMWISTKNVGAGTSWGLPGTKDNAQSPIRFKPGMTPDTTRTSPQEQYPIGMSGLYLGQEDYPFSVGPRTSGGVGSILDKVLSSRGSITRAVELLTPEERSRLITELYLRSTGPQASLRSLNSEYGLSNNLGEMSLDKIVYNESLIRRFAEGGLVSLDENLLRQEGVSLNTAKNAVSYINNGGWPDNLTRLAFAIAMRESNGNPNAFSRYSPTNSDTGLFQINEASYAKQPWFDLNRLKDGSYNAGVAYKHVSQGGTHFLPWALTSGFDGTNGWDWSYYANSEYFAPGSQARNETIRRTKLFWDAFKGSSSGNETTDATNNNSNKTNNKNYVIPERGLLGRLSLVQRGEGGNTGGVPAPDGSYQPPVNTGNPDGVLAVAFAKQQLGEPYVPDADGPDQWDCSGLTAAAYNVGVPDGYKKYSLISYSTSQAERLKINVRRTSGTPGDGSMPEIQDNFNIGDILYFTNTGTGSSGKHVSMYAGNGQIIEAGNPVQMNSLNNDWNKKYFNFGGSPIAKFASGGFISGPGGPRSDVIPAMLSDGEYVVKASSVSKYGKGFMDQLNSGQLSFGGGGIIPKYANGGIVGSTAMPAFNMPEMASTSAGMTNNNYAGNSSSNNSNTSVKVVINGAGGKNANAIANKVISMINSANSRRNHSRSI
jgi:TP901 family phage tail tape measure protein